jgi:hypothetical protein
MALNVNNLIANLLPPLHSDTLANLVWWTDGELSRFFDEAVKSHARRHGVFVKRSITAITLVQGTAVYDAPTRHIDTMHVALAGVALIASSTSELELLDDAFKTTQSTPTHWYSDREGQNKIGFYPVPDALNAGLLPEIIYHDYPAELDEAHVNTVVPVPTPIGDYLEAQVLRAAYNKESDAALPEVAQNLSELIRLYENVILQLWGESQ